MKIKRLSLIILIAVASAGCLKDTQQAVSHVNDVNMSLRGTWTQTKNTTYYYDAAGKMVYFYNGPLLTLQFDGDKTVYHTNANNEKVPLSYTITTQGNFDYINITGDATGPHQYQLESLMARSLSFSETILAAADGITIIVNGKSITYFKSVQENQFVKNNLPLN